MEIGLDLRAKPFNEYLENGEIEKIVFPELLESLLQVKTLPNGKVNPDTVDSTASAAMLAYVATQLMPTFNSDTFLSQYETLLQKSIFFAQTNVETKKQFDEVFEKYRDSKNVLFRGLNEAKYRLYSSLQRNWITDKLYEKYQSYETFLSGWINNAKQQEGGILSKYLDKIGIDPKNDLAVLSFFTALWLPNSIVGLDI